MNQSPHSANPDPHQPYSLLSQRLRSILATVPLAQQQKMIQDMAQELGVDILQCAAAMLHLLQPNAAQHPVLGKPAPVLPPLIRMVRYRLDIGNQHQLSPAQLKQTLVAESGVEINNINNISIRDTYTLIDLPDAMPQDIFQHLKTVEINGRKLGIKRVKSRKKRHNAHYRGKTDISNHGKENSVSTAQTP